MMKRAKTIICIILSLVMLALVGCSQDINGDNRTKKLLVDFENVSSVEYVNFNNDDGKTMFSKEHATRGTYCLHYVIEEDEYRDGASYPAIDLSVSGMNIANVDEIDYFALDIYSAKAQDVYLSLAFYDEKGKTVYSDVTKVKANVQTEARFYVDFDEQTVLSKAKIIELIFAPTKTPEFKFKDPLNVTEPKFVPEKTWFPEKE